MTNLIVS